MRLQGFEMNCSWSLVLVVFVAQRGGHRYSFPCVWDVGSGRKSDLFQGSIKCGSGVLQLFFACWNVQNEPSVSQ